MPPPAFPGGAGTSSSPLASSSCWGDAWLCQFAPQPGIWDPEEEKRKGGLAADLGNAKGPMLQKVGVLPSPQDLKETQPPKNEQGGNWADLVCLALASLGTQMQEGKLQQTAEVRLWLRGKTGWAGG